ncbi:helix-turn-helix domain-containing protein [Paraburkholderia youngii]|uniref:helix-turn-helix domain-containing protein n=1 Tax=Paraburkholderia youngii TaxID=2782701 RepID=UPI003D1F5D5B
MILAHRVAPEPNDARARYLACAAGMARFAYKWALAEWKRQYESQANQAPPQSRRKWRRKLRRVALTLQARAAP